MIDSVEDGTLTVLVIEQPVVMLIVSGATCNIVTETKFQQLTTKSDIILQCPEKQVYPFGSTTPLHVKGIFVADFKANGKSETVTAKIQVIKGAHICVLGRKTAVQLGLLRIGEYYSTKRHRSFHG